MTTQMQPTNSDLMQAILRLQTKFVDLDAKVDAQGANLEAKIAALDAKIDTQGERLEAKIAEQGVMLEAKIAALDTKVDAQGERLEAKIAEQGESLEAKIKDQSVSLEAKIADQDKSLRSEIIRQRKTLGAQIVSVEERLHKEIVDVKLDVKALEGKVQNLGYELRSEAHGQTLEIYAFMEAQKSDLLEAIQQAKDSFREEIKFTFTHEAEERRLMQFETHQLGVRLQKLEKVVLPT